LSTGRYRQEVAEKLSILSNVAVANDEEVDSRFRRPGPGGDASWPGEGGSHLNRARFLSTSKHSGT